MRYAAVLAAKAATIASWILTGVDILPDGWLWDLKPDVALYLVAAGCVGAYWMITRAHARPVVEVYEAGKAIGRREIQLEQQCENVTRLSEVPNLTVVNGGR